MEEYDRLLKEKFKQGLSSKEIATAVGVKLNVWRSVRTTQRHLNRLGLLAKGSECISDEAISLIKEYIFAGDIGVNMIWRNMRRRHKIHIKRQTVRDIVAIIQPDRAARMRKGCLKRRVYKVGGPNHLWHMDGNDKLKPFGFSIHGCIDGYSRQLLWLKISRSNKDPTVILGHYLDAIEKCAVVPLVLRCDRGTENFKTGDIQMLLRSNHNDGLADTATMYGKSTHNQRIEFFWSYLKRRMLQQYIDLFKDLEMAGLHDRSNAFRVNSLVFCFMDLLRENLSNVMVEWNSHRIRNNKHAEVPSGVPNHLYMCPEAYGVTNNGQPFDVNYMTVCRSMAKEEVSSDEYLEFSERTLNLMLCNGWVLPKNADEALDLYGKLICLESQ